MTIKASNFPTVRPTLDLNFAQTKRLDPRVTFSRSSAGTYLDANGVLQSAATNVARFDHNPTTGESLGLLVEEARTNLVRRNNQYWNVFEKGGSFGTDADGFYNVLNDGVVRLYQYEGGTAPDGLAAAKLKIPSGSGLAFMRTPFDVYFAGSTVHTLSFWFRNSSGNPLTANCVFELVNTGSGVRASSTVNVVSTTNKTTLLNDWQRVWITFSSTTGSGDFVKFSWTRTASDQVFEIAGLQLEAGSFPTSYIPTPATFTGRASTATYYDSAGIIQTAGNGVARSTAFFPDSNGVFRPAGLLLEAAGTNLLNGSQTFATAGGSQNNWVDTNITRDGTLRTSPDGTANALRITASAGNATIISSAAIGTSAQRTFSIFLRRVTGTGNIQYTLDNGTTWTTQAITGSWVRYSFPATTADQQVGVRIVTSGDAIELWGAQLEAFPYATSYIPTVASTVTRAADTSTSATVTRSADVAKIDGSNYLSFINVNEGTWFSSVPKLVGTGGRIFDSRSSILFAGANASGYAYASSGSNQVNASYPLKGAVVYNTTDVHGAANGTLNTANSGGRAINHTYIDIGSANTAAAGVGFLNAPISRLTYFPVRLSDATLATITL